MITFNYQKTVWLEFSGSGIDLVNHYAEVFWRPYLGVGAYALYSVLRGCFVHEQTPEYNRLLLGILGKSPYDNLRAELAVLEREYVVKEWTDRHGRQRYDFQLRLPLLTSSQVSTLPISLQRHHQGMFDVYVGWGSSSITYEEWQQVSLERITFLSPLDPAKTEACEIESEENERQEQMASVRRELTADKKRVILERDGRTCRYCGQPANAVDHILPVSQGGDNDPDNLAAACRTCNSRKNGRTPAQAGMTLHPIPPALPSQSVPIVDMAVRV